METGKAHQKVVDFQTFSIFYWRCGEFVEARIAENVVSG
jgi:hypothetical protein